MKEEIIIALKEDSLTVRDIAEKIWNKSDPMPKKHIEAVRNALKRMIDSEDIEKTGKRPSLYLLIKTQPTVNQSPTNGEPTLKIPENDEISSTERYKDLNTNEPTVNQSPTNGEPTLKIPENDEISSEEGNKDLNTNEPTVNQPTNFSDLFSDLSITKVELWKAIKSDTDLKGLKTWFTIKPGKSERTRKGFGDLVLTVNELIKNKLKILTEGK